MLARKQTTEIGGQRWKFIEAYLASVPRPVHRPTNNNIRRTELVANKIIRLYSPLHCSLQDKILIAAGRRLLALLAILRGAVGVQEQGARLAWNIRSHKPGVGITQQGMRGQLVGVLDPGVLGLLGGRNTR